MGYVCTWELVRNTWAALGQAGFVSKPGLCASDLVLIDLVQGRLNYCNGSLHKKLVLHSD